MQFTGGLQGLLGDDMRGRITGDMRGDAQARIRPEGMVGWQWFSAKHIKSRPGKLTTIKGRDQIILDQMFAASDLDQSATPGHF